MANAKITRFLDKSAPEVTTESRVYNSSWQTGRQKLTIDARGDRIYMHISEYNIDTNRSKDISMSIEREVWDDFRAQLNKYDGSII
jgi:hypothetical protein